MTIGQSGKLACIPENKFEMLSILLFKQIDQADGPFEIYRPDNSTVEFEVILKSANELKATGIGEVHLAVIATVSPGVTFVANHRGT